MSSLFVFPLLFTLRRSLIEQLHRLQAMFMNTTNKPAQTGTCVLVRTCVNIWQYVFLCAWAWVRGGGQWRGSSNPPWIIVYFLQIITLLEDQTAKCHCWISHGERPIQLCTRRTRHHNGCQQRHFLQMDVDISNIYCWRPKWRSFKSCQLTICKMKLTYKRNTSESQSTLLLTMYLLPITKPALLWEYQCVLVNLYGI